MTLNNLAAVYRSQGNYKGAELLHRRTLLIWEKALPRTHPNVTTVLDNLATDQEKPGNYSGAEGLLLRAQTIREKADAESPCQRSLDILEKSSPRDYPALIGR
jgi:hypothetical protein